MKSRYFVYYFDIDGTLTDSAKSHALFCNDLNEEEGFNLRPVNLEEVFEVKNLMGTPMERLLLNYGFPSSEIPRLTAIYKNRFPEDSRYISKPFVGVEEILTDLISPKISLVYLTSNTLKNIKRDLGEKIFSMFDYGYDKESLDRNFSSSKGSAIHADLWQSHDMIDPRNAVVVGDTKGDYEASQLSGCDFIAVNYGWGEWSGRSDLKVAKNVSELRDFLFR